MTNTEIQRRYRARAKAAGRCMVCGRSEPRPNRATCQACNATATARVAKMRKPTIVDDDDVSE